MTRNLLVLLAVLLVSAAIGADDDEEWRSAKAEKAANAKREQIHAEIGKLGVHDWAGDYYAGDGLGVNTSLLVAPSAGYLFEWHGCLGLYDRNYGPITATSGNLKLTFTFKNSRDGFRGIAPQLTLVSWGPRRYLVPSDDVVGFCNEVNRGDEPRATAGGFYFLRRGDQEKKVTGTPKLPAEYQDYLLAKPVEATVLAVGASTTRPSVADWKFKDTRLTLDAGKKQGLKVGMELVLIQPDRVFERVKITKVDDKRSEAIMTLIGEEALGPKAGWRMSTRAPWHELAK